MAELRFEAAGVTARTHVGDRVLVEPFNLTLTERAVGIIGANGSGKSTVVRLLNGLVPPTTGRVVVDGLDVARHGAAVRRRVGFCFTDPSAQLVMATPVEDVELSLRASIRSPRERRDRAMSVLERYGLTALAHDSVHSLSGGQKQLLALASVLAVGPRVLVADEPTTLLDRANTRRIAHYLFAVDAQLVLVTHDLELAGRCDRVLVVDRARVIYDGPATDAVQVYTTLADLGTTADLDAADTVARV